MKSNFIGWISVLLLSLLSAAILNWRFFSVTNIDWLLEGDLAQTLVGWEFYRVSPVETPITKIANLFPGSGFSIVQTDTVPWVSVLVKSLFNFFGVDQPYQFIGLWVILCCVLQGVYANKFANLLNLEPQFKFLLAFLFLFSPVFLFRFGHFALMAHWIILATIYEAVRVSRGLDLSWPRCLYLTILMSFALGVHPYHFAIAAPIFILTLLLSRNTTSFKITFLAATGLLAYLSVKTLAFSAIKDVKTSDFGACSTDVIAPLNSFGRSLFVPALRSGWCQAEGFCYLGIGLLILLVILRKELGLICRSVWRQNVARVFVVLLILYVFYSLASPIHFAGNAILSIPLYKFIEPLPSIFRSSGRWIWPAYYLLLIAVACAFQRSQLQYKKVWLTGFILLHLIEFTPNYRSLKTFPVSANKEIDRIVSLMPRPSTTNKKMYLYPRVVSVSCGFKDNEWRSEDWALVMLSLARTGWAIDSGTGARFDQSWIDKCREQNLLPPPADRPLITKVLTPEIHSSTELLPGIFVIESEAIK